MNAPQHRLVFESFGLTAEVATEDPALLEAVPGVLPPDWRASDGEPFARFAVTRDLEVFRDGRRVARVDDPARALLRLGSIVRQHIALHAPGHVFVHAGVVAVGGSAIVIPGTSHSGKTTLVAELVRAGATYYSDEYAPVDPDGLVHPFAKPLSVRGPGRDGSGDLVPVPAEQIGTEPIRAGLVVVTTYEAGARWRPAEHTSGEGAYVLLGHIVPARTRPEAAMAAASRLASDARIVSGKRGEALEMASALLSV